MLLILISCIVIYRSYCRGYCIISMKEKPCLPGFLSGLVGRSRLGTLRISCPWLIPSKQCHSNYKVIKMLYAGSIHWFHMDMSWWPAPHYKTFTNTTCPHTPFAILEISKLCLQIRKTKSTDYLLNRHFKSLWAKCWKIQLILKILYLQNIIWFILLYWL